MSEAAIITIVFGATGLLFAVLGTPLMLGKIAPNPIYGCRTKRTLADSVTWYAVNRVCGRNLIVAGVFITVSAGIAPQLVPSLGLNLVTVVLVAVLLISLGFAFIHCNRITQDV